MAQIILDGNSNLIQGDFDSATVNNRTKLQTSTTNASTGIYAVPNGSATGASWQAANSANPTNASKILIATNGSTDVQLVSGINGTGTYLPLSIYNSGDVRFQVGTSGELGVRTGVGTVGYGTSGQVLTSAGTGASPTWSAPASPPATMTLLGTITPTAVNSISLSGLTLTSYKSLFIVLNTITTGGTSTCFISGSNIQTGGGFGDISAASSGTMWLDLATGAIGGSIANNTIDNTALPVGGLTNVSTSTTQIYFRLETTKTFTAAGSIRIYGVT